MSLLGLRFRIIANRLQLLDYNHPDLTFERVSELVSTKQSNRWERALALKQAPEESHIAWSLLYLDAVINLEDCQGKFTRVGIRFVSKEFQANRLLKQVQKPALNNVYKSLKNYCY